MMIRRLEMFVHRSCRERLAKHKDRQRLKLQAKFARQGSDDTASLEDDDEAVEAQQAAKATITRAGRKCRRPSMLLPSIADASDSGAGASPEPQLAVRDSASLQQAPHSGVRAAVGGDVPPQCADSVPIGSGWSSQGIASYGGQAGCRHQQQQQQQQQQQRLPPSAFDQAPAMAQRCGGLMLGWAPQRDGLQARSRRSASMGQMQVC